MTKKPNNVVSTPRLVKLVCIHSFPVRVTGVGIVKPKGVIEVDHDLAEKLLEEGRFEKSEPKSKSNKEAK
jgi:hypothetical protein